MGGIRGGGCPNVIGARMCNPSRLITRLRRKTLCELSINPNARTILATLPDFDGRGVFFPYDVYFDTFKKNEAITGDINKAELLINQINTELSNRNLNGIWAETDSNSNIHILAYNNINKLWKLVIISTVPVWGLFRPFPHPDGVFGQAQPERIEDMTIYDPTEGGRETCLHNKTITFTSTEGVRANAATGLLDENLVPTEFYSLEETLTIKVVR
tara:strand:+ start:97 stop:741 length:645 start_codon:yes stop_codon:yes gene_type:complete